MFDYYNTVIDQDFKRVRSEEKEKETG